jgi:hypothetical protein
MAENLIKYSKKRSCCVESTGVHIRSMLVKYIEFLGLSPPESTFSKHMYLWIGRRNALITMKEVY